MRFITMPFLDERGQRLQRRKLIIGSDFNIMIMIEYGEEELGY
jgi:hypothetical protein